MKKLYTIIAIMTMVAFSGNAYAEMRYGVSAALTQIEASGKETEGGETTTAEVDNIVVIPSLFVEYSISDTFSLGLDYIPLKADVSDSTHSRTDTETSVTGTKTTTSTTRVQNAEAEIKNHMTLYGTYDFGPAYIKAGVAHFSLETQALATGSNYGSEDFMGTVIGLGKSSDNIRVELLYTDYEDISLTSSVARTGVTTNNKIDADLDTVALKISYLF